MSFAPEGRALARLFAFSIFRVEMPAMSKPLGIIAALSGLVAVACGAFGAHGLRAVLSPTMLDTWQTAVSYQFHHTLVLVVLALLPAVQGPLFRRAAWLFAAGIGVFSGSLYALVLLDARWLGMITPLGGVLLMIGWATLLVAVIRHRRAA